MWERSLLSLFDDLEQQAEGLALAERDAAVAEHSQAEYATVDLAARVHGALGWEVSFRLRGGLVVSGVVERAGADWCLVGGASPAEAQGEWVVRLAAVVLATGLGPRAVPAGARGVAARLGLKTVFRRLADSREPAVLALEDATQLRGRVARAGADFVELVGETERQHVVPIAALAALRRA